jgi:hypothetical protein
MEKLGMALEKSFSYRGVEVVCYAMTNPSKKKMAM